MLNARKKGAAFELAIRDRFRELGYENAVSSRSESKNMDDKGVDLCYTGPFNVQCKAIENMGSAHSVLAAMPDDENWNVVFHKKNRQGVVVSMSMDDFLDIVLKLKLNGIIK